MRKLTLSSSDARLAVGGDHDDFDVVSDKVIDEWRWGNVYKTIIKDADGNLWGVNYRVQTGDNYHHEFENVNEVDFYPVVAKEVTTVVYERLKD